MTEVWILMVTVTFWFNERPPADLVFPVHYQSEQQCLDAAEELLSEPFRFMKPPNHLSQTEKTSEGVGGVRFKCSPLMVPRA